MDVTRKHIIPLAAAVLLVAAFLVVFLSVRQKNVVVAFHNLPSAAQSAIRKAIEQKPLKGLQVEFAILSADKPVEHQLSQKPAPDILICRAGLVMEKATTVSAERNAGIVQDVLVDMPNALKNSAVVQNSLVLAVPLLVDHYELAVSRNPSGQHPFLFAGGKSHVLLALAGSIAESNFGPAVALQLALDCRQTDLSQIPMMQSIAKIMANQILSGSIPLSTLTLQEEELSVYMTNAHPDAVFMPLSFHRTLPLDALKRHSAVVFPSRFNERALTAPVIYGVPLSGKKRINATVCQILLELVTMETQEFLSKESGLAPVHANAQTPDIQSSDVRYWVSATNPPLATLGEAAFETSAELDKAAQTFRDMILEHVHSDSSRNLGNQ